MSTEGLPVNNVVGTSVDLGARSVQNAANSASSSQNADSAAASADAAWKFSRIAQGAAGDSATAVSDAEAAAVAAIAAAQNATITSNLYPSLDGDLGANAAIAAGLIPNGALFNVSVPALSTPQRLADEYLNVDGVATLTGQTIASGKMVDGLSITSGDLLPTANPRAAAINGASIISLPDNRSVGFSIPAGSTGATSYISGDVPLSDMRGKRIKMVQFLTATSNWLTDTPRSAVVAQVRVGNAVATITPISSAIVQYGTIITQTVIFDVPVDADYCGLNIQVNSNPGTKGYSRDIKISHIHYELVTLNVGQTQNDAMLDVRLAPLAAGVNHASITADKALLTSGNVYGTASTTAGAGQVSNGASFILDPAGNRIGFDIPASAGGTTTGGGGSYITAWFSAAGLANKTVTITTTYNATSGFLSGTSYSSIALQVRRSGVISTGTVISRSLAQTGTVLTQTTVYLVSELDNDIGATFQVSAGHPSRNYDRSIAISSVAYIIAPSAGETQNDVMLNSVTAGIKAEAGVYSTDTLTAGTGKEFVTPAAASAAATAVTITDRTAIATEAGYYNADFNWTLASYATLKASSSGIPHIHYELPDDSTLNPADYQPMWVRKSGTLDRVKVTARNARYAVHCEASGANPDSKISVRNSWIEHLGNVVPGWPSQAAWGCGVSSGWELKSEGNVYRAPFCAFSYHTNIAFSKPSYVENRNDVLIGTAEDGLTSGMALRVQPLGSGQRDQYRAYGCLIVGDLYYRPTPWMPTTLAYQPASHTEIEMAGFGNSPAVFRINDFGRALKIVSAIAPGSSVAVSGDAVAVLFGDVTTYAGVTNLPAYAHGSFDISGEKVGPKSDQLITSIGKRLGNCTSVNKTLSIVVNGGAAVNVVFNSDYTNVANSVILSTINAALAGTAVASEYALGDRYRPRWTDEEKSLWNATAVGIPMGSVLAYDTSYKRVRLMTSADPTSLFAGVAWEDIYPGKFGRVKICGYLSIVDVLRSDSTAFVFGDTFSVGSTPGVVAKGGSQGLLMAIRPDAVRVGSLKI